MSIYCGTTVSPNSGHDNVLVNTQDGLELCQLQPMLQYNVRHCAPKAQHMASFTVPMPASSSWKNISLEGAANVAWSTCGGFLAITLGMCLLAVHELPKVHIVHVLPKVHLVLPDMPFDYAAMYGDGAS